MLSVLTANGKSLNIKSDEDIIYHFSDNKNCGRIILRQINTDRMYDVYLKDKTDLVILDIGANIGLFTLYASDSAKRIVSVEPTPSHQELFKKITQDLDNVELVQAALADRDETIHFYTSVTNTTQNSIVNTGAVKGGDMFEVQGYCFDTLLDKYNLDHVDFCKIDIEGSEMVAITVEQMKKAYDRIDKMFIDVHSTTRESNIRWEDDLIDNRKKIENILHESGYKTKVMPGYYQDVLYVYKD